jgi:hypothetical protein
MNQHGRDGGVRPSIPVGAGRPYARRRAAQQRRSRDAPRLRRAARPRSVDLIVESFEPATASMSGHSNVTLAHREQLVGLPATPRYRCKTRGRRKRSVRLSAIGVCGKA